MATRRSSRKARRAVAEATRSHSEVERTAESPEIPSPTPAGQTAEHAAAEAAAPDSDKPARTRALDQRSGGRRSGRREAEEKSSSRRGSQRRRRSSSETETSSRRPTIGRDGKANISCPNCGARYKILEAHFENKVKCTQCHRTFFPHAAGTNRRAPNGNRKPIIYGVVAIFGIIIVGVIINSATKPDKPVVFTRHTPEVIDTGSSTKEVTTVMQWAEAVGERVRFNTVYTSNMDAIQKKLGIEKKNPFSRNFGEAKTILEKKIVTALFDADQTLVFRAYKPSYGYIADEAMVADKAGFVRLSLSPRDSKIHPETAEVDVHYAWDRTDGRFKVSDWVVRKMARGEYLAAAMEPKPKSTRPKHKAHGLIGKAKTVSSTWNGRHIKIAEAKLVPLPHLQTTSEEDRGKIDKLVDQMVDLNASGMLFNRASNALEEFGKAAVPRVLNKMYETKYTGSERDVAILNRLCRFLRHLTGERFGFNPANQATGSDIGGTEKERVSALKQWYAWWARYYDRDDWRNIDDDDEVELTTEEIEAKRQAERKARADARRRRK